MRLTRLSLRNVAGVATADLVVPHSGPSVVLAPNEAGKSTLLRAYRLLMSKTGHRGRTAEVRALQPVGRDVGSTIEAHLIIGDEVFEVARTYNTGPSSALTVRGQRTRHVTGKQADDLLHARFTATVDQDLFELLLFEQGRRLETLDGARSATLVTALQAEDAEVPAAGADDLLGAVRGLVRAAFHKTNGTPIGDLGRLRRQVEAAQQHRDGIAAQVEALRGDVDTARLDTAVDAATAALAAADAELARARAVAQADGARRLAAAAAARVEQRAQTVARVAALVADAERLAAGVAQAEADHAIATADHAAAVADVDRATTARAAAAADVATARRQLASALATRIAAGEAMLTAEPVTDAVAMEVAGLQQDVALARAAVTGGAWQVRVSARRELEIRIDGATHAVTSGGTLAREVTSAVVHTDVDGTKVVVEADDARRGQVEALHASEVALADRLAALGAADAAAVADRRTAREALTREVAMLASRHADLQAEASDVPSDTDDSDAEGADDGADVPALERALTAARTRLAEAPADSASAVAAAAAAIDRAAAVLAERVAQHRHADEQRLQAEAALATERSKQEDATLEVEAASAAAALTELGITGGETSAEPAALEAAREQAVAALDRAKEARADARAQRGSIAALEATLATAADQAGSISDQFLRAMRDAEAAVGLLARLEAAREAQGARYREPLQDRIGALLTRLHGFPCRVELDDDLRIQARSDPSGRMIPWAQLSGGAKEQAAVVTGLAIAELAGDDGVPFWIDDAVVFTDDERVEGLKALLSETTAQVIVLTCRRELAEGLPQAEVTLTRG